MSIIDKILGDIEKRVECFDIWQVEIASGAKRDKTAQIYSWDAESHTAAAAIWWYLVARGMTKGTPMASQGSYICITKNQDKP